MRILYAHVASAEDDTARALKSPGKSYRKLFALCVYTTRLRGQVFVPALAIYRGIYAVYDTRS